MGAWRGNRKDEGQKLSNGEPGGEESECECKGKAV